jgi:acetate kinase
MNPNALLTFNAGSSSLKIGVFDLRDGLAKSKGRATIDFETTPLILSGNISGSSLNAEVAGNPKEDFSRIIEQALGHLAERFTGGLAGVAHRVVHGGMTFDGPVLLSDDTIDRIEALVPLAPLHQPQALRVITAVRKLEPDVPQFASFDTAFHTSQEDIVRRLAIPRAMHDDGVRRYGFHGLSYAFIATRLMEIDPEAAKARVIAAHLGSGASICAMKAGISRDTSMGFSALDGIPMATRPGWLDPGALLYLMRSGMRQPERIEQFLYHECGLLGVSGISGDTRALLKDPSHEASEAIDLFCLRISGEISRQTATLGGIDAVVFTAGIGEHQPEIRGRVVERLAWLGIELDDGANERNATIISTAESRIKVFVIPADEEQVIADDALSVLARHRL